MVESGTLTIYNDKWDDLNVDLSPAQISVICDVLGFGPANDYDMELKMWHDKKLELMLENDIGKIAHLISRKGYKVYISKDNNQIIMKREG